MDLLQMRYLVAISESESMTRAAEQLHVSQSALSLSYKRLEEELGVKLFRRDGRKLRLTDPGKHFCDKSREILKMVNALESDMARWHESEEDSLVLSSEVGDFTNEARMLFNVFFPERQILELRDNARDTVKSVRAGNVPFAATCHDHTDGELVSELILEEPMYGFVNSRSPLAGFDTLTMPQMCGGTLITQREDFSIADVMVEFFAKANVTLPRRHFVNDPESMVLTVHNGLGSTFIPESVVNMWKQAPFPMAAGTRMIPMAEPYCRRRVYLTYHRGTSKTKAALHYMEYLRHFGAFVQRFREIPNPRQLEAYAEKHCPELELRGHTGPAPSFMGSEGLAATK